VANIQELETMNSAKSIPFKILSTALASVVFVVSAIVYLAWRDASGGAALEPTASIPSHQAERGSTDTVVPPEVHSKSHNDEPASELSKHVVGTVSAEALGRGSEGKALAESLADAAASIAEHVVAGQLPLRHFGVGVRDALFAVAGTDITAFDEYCETYGIIPLSKTAPSADSVRSALKDYQAWFMSAILDTDSIEVRWIVRSGIEFQPEFQSRYSRSRDNARAFWTSLLGKDRNSLEITIPIVAHDLNGTVFDAKFALEFGFDPATERWILVRGHYYDVPNEIQIVTGPI
jgi:hypothetical protein